MRRHAISLTEIASYTNLLQATYKAARSKRHRPDVAAFLADLDHQLAHLSTAILQDQVPHNAYRSFYIRDPKKRLIHAPCFADRVLHHAILNQTESIFERLLLPGCYACRPGKGVHRAVTQVQRNLQRFDWYVKVDIAGYFPSVDHASLLKLLARHFKGQPFLYLLTRIIHGYQAQPGKGLPIGSLTSQHFANLYLSGADRYLIEQSAVRAQVRYMDDIIWWCHDKIAARDTLKQLTDYLHQHRQLLIKPNPVINRSRQGVSYCGYRILPGAIRLSPRKKRRYHTLRTTYEQQWQQGILDDLALQQALNSVYAMTQHADSRAWRQNHLQKYPDFVSDSIG